ncbi:DUF6501 family protein [Sutcliffiella deserti]|uniref:DUF6501 family protein n=1 Tax=Sutcliffiella deserti TaxID=2875501 RepID=UPI001CC0E04C|nr:DUF6501 family protein [Sutcliffiella deserti]
MIHQTWKNREAIKVVKCIHTNAEKYLVDNMLTKGKTYEVKNETEEFYFLEDNSGHIGGYYKNYFETI